MTTATTYGGEENEGTIFQELCNRETTIVNAYLNNDELARTAMQNILLFTWGRNAEEKLIDLVEAMVYDGTIKEEINMWLVNFKQIIEINGGDNRNSEDDE